MHLKIKMERIELIFEHFHRIREWFGLTETGRPKHIWIRSIDRKAAAADTTWPKIE